MRVDIVTIFPEYVEQALSCSILGRARASGVVGLAAHDLRQWTCDAHRSVDDAPYGGGPGMVMKPEPMVAAVEALSGPGAHVILLTPQGQVFTQETAQRLAAKGQLLILCGHYEGVDERVAQLADEEVSLGDFILTGAEPAAVVVTDAVVRLVPGVLGNADSPRDESFCGLLEYPQYTRPPRYRGWAVPEVLISGHHDQVRRWRRRQALTRTATRRPDLLARAELTDEDWRLLGEVDLQSPPDPENPES
jgi:tRNA (guanine37-N1)-methyltransferase